NPILTLFGATDVLRPAALEYGYVIAIGLPFTMISTALNAMIRADGSPKFAMVSMLLGAIINTVFDPIFIFIFDMGVRGAAIATILGQIISFLVSIFYLPRFKTFHFDRSALRLHKRVCLSVLSLGVSSFITQIAITVVMALFNNLLAVYGAASVYGSEIPLTAMGIVMKVNQIMLSILVGIAIGAQPVIGFNYGCKNFHRVKRAFEVAIAAAEIIAIIAFFIFQFAPMSVVSIFGSEEGLYNEFAVKCFRIFLMLCPLNGFQTVAAIYLQAIGKPIKSAVVTLSRQIVFLVPVALLLPKAMGVVGVLWAGSAADALAFILALAMIVYEMKKLKKMAA
ncbi:MAG TPA: polysaccharide biosynthesis C-terminal domain-containing protein, partial [Butyricicoccus pullicaecorum]|nr:polysaccharide biosynthesis C-terminal domain-containing protein [Butyricicoccus pullicaecorum]